MSTSFDYGTGRRKTATARTRLYAGGGQIVVNDRPMEDYFPRKTLQIDHSSASGSDQNP